MIATLGLALLAGILTVLSPCVLPLLPIVLGTAASEHRFGPIALAVGLALSFVTVGLFVATIGFAAGLDTDVFRFISAVLLIGIGLVLLVPKLQAQFALAASPVGNWVDERLGGFATNGLWGQFGLGLLLGLRFGFGVGLRRAHAQSRRHAHRWHLVQHQIDVEQQQKRDHRKPRA